jgi:hypothetical protein
MTTIRISQSGRHRGEACPNRCASDSLWGRTEEAADALWMGECDVEADFVAVAQLPRQPFQRKLRDATIYGPVPVVTYRVIVGR